MKQTLKCFIALLLALNGLQVAAQSNASQFDLYNAIAEQSSAPSSYYAVVETYKQQAGSMSSDEIASAKAVLRTKIFELMRNVPARDGQYDITSFVGNPAFSTFSSNSYITTITDWTTPNNSFRINNSSGIVECFNVKNEASIYQEISDMPAGEYTVKVQGFYRNGEWKQALANYERGSNVVKGSIYVDALNNTKPLKSIFADGCYMLECKSNKSADVFAVVSGRGFPHSHTIGTYWGGTTTYSTPDLAKKAFEHGHYWNEMTTYHADGKLTIGIILAAGAPNDTWIAIDNFRLYYSSPAPVTIAEETTVPDDTHANVVLKKQFVEDQLTPLAVPCDIPASVFKAVYAIGSLDETTQTAVLCPVDHVSANVPCYVVAKETVDELTVVDTYIAAAQPDQIPVMWDGGLVYRVAGTFSWKTLTVSKHEYDATYFTNFKYVDGSNMDFVANLENFRVRQFLENTDYSDPNAASVIAEYFKPSPARLDIPHNIGVPVPASQTRNAVVKFGLKSDFSDAQSRTVVDGSDMAYMPNLIPGNTYYYKVEAGGEVLSQGKFQVEGPVRMIYAPSISNIRDLGGWTVQGGKQVRYGLIFRGGEANGQHSSVAEDRQTLINLGVGAEIDLRSDNKYDSGNGQVGICAFGFDNKDYFFSDGCRDNQVSNLTDATSKARFKNWFLFILEHLREGKSVYFHCVWGADRTGLTAVLLEGLLGLSQEQMNLEYELTSLSFAGNRPKGGTQGYGDHQALIEKIKTYEGATLRDKFDTYWIQEVGISQDLINEFRNIMLCVVLDENATNAPEAADNVNVVVNRTIGAGSWNTICLPFAMTEQQVKAAFGNEVQLADFTSYIPKKDAEDNVVGLTINFDLVTKIEANHPYMIKVPASITQFAVDQVKIAPVATPCKVYNDGQASGKFTGTYVADHVIPYSGSDVCMFVSGNKLYYATSRTQHMKAYRAYFWFSDILSGIGESQARINLTSDENTTAIMTVTDKKAVKDEWYTIGGVKLSGEPTQKGLYIHNGNTVVK